MLWLHLWKFSQKMLWKIYFILKKIVIGNQQTPTTVVDQGKPKTLVGRDSGSVWIPFILLKTENWKHCIKIICKCVNNTVRHILMKVLLEKEICRSREQCMGPTDKHIPVKILLVKEVVVSCTTYRQIPTWNALLN